MNFIGTYWALVPSLVAIILALITKDIHRYLSASCWVLFFIAFLLAQGSTDL